MLTTRSNGALRRKSLLADGGLLSLCLCLVACGPAEARFGPEVRVGRPERSVMFGLGHRDRFGLQDLRGGAAAAGEATAEQGQGGGFEGEAPADWQVLPPTDMRQLNYRVAGNAQAECYLTAGNLRGGMLANANRWIEQQFGQPPLSQQEFEQLPRHVLLGQPARLVEVAGSFTGMGGAVGDDFKLLGLIAGTDEQMVTLKFTGPRAVVEAQRAAFLAFAATVRRGSGKGPAPSASAAPPASTGGYRAATPTGWQVQPPSDMRLLNWTVGGDATAECYLTAGGLRGGRLANVNRWVANQFGQAPLTAEQFAALPHHPLLGGEAVLVECEGDFQSMTGTARPGFKLLGLVGGGDDDMVTLKFTGPAAIVDRERAAFLQLAASIAVGAAPKSPAVPAPGSGTMPDDAAHAGVVPGHDVPPSSPYVATIAKDWTPLGDTGSRLLRHRFGTQGECYVGVLGGDIDAMLGIWCGEMSAAVPDAAAIAALPRAPMLGGQAVLLDLAGPYTSMGGQSLADARSLVAAVLIDGSIVFAKCLGPAAEVEAQRAAFQEFVRTLRRGP